MKRIFAAVMALMLILLPTGLAETTEKYDHAETFAGHGYSVVHRDGKKGVVNADGSEIVPPEWDSVVIDDEGRKALCMNYPEGPVAVIDLNTGEAYHQAESLPTAYVSERYALQGNVRVYTRGEFVGLEDAEGNALCEAKYDYIDAFMGLDCAIVHIGEKKGVISRDGRETVSVKWDYVNLTPDGKTAWCYNHNYPASPEYIFDTETGEELYRTGEDTHVRAEYDTILTWNARPPYRTDVYDTQMRLLFSVNAKLERYERYYLAEFNDGSRGMYDLEGKKVIEGLSDISYIQDGYAAYFRSEYIYASEAEQVIDEFGNGLDRLLWKNNGKYRKRNCLEWVLYRFGMETQPRQETKKYLGVIHVSGERFEYDGAYQADDWSDYPRGAIKIGGEGLYIVNVAAEDGESGDRWTYFDSEGNQAVPGHYSFAYMFVDGSAVVRRDNADYLIDRNGETICTVCEDVCWNASNNIALEQPVIAACYENCAYHRVIDRKGNFISDTRYKTFRYDLEGHFFADAIDGGATVTDIYGNDLLKDSWDGVSDDANNHTDGAWAWKGDLLYHVDLKTGERTSLQGYAQLKGGAARLPGAENWVVFDEMGNPVGPYYEQEDDF